MGESWDIFISYAGRDESRARELFHLLRTGCRVFFAKESLQAGDNWGEQIVAALLTTTITAVMVSIHSQRAWYQGEENARAIEIARDSGGRKRVVPIYLDGFPKASDWNLFGLNVLHGLDVRLEGGLGQVAQKLLRILRNKPLEMAHPISTDHVLASIPQGPGLDGGLVDEALIDAYAENFSAARADLLVDRANAFRKQADPDATVIRKADVPRVESVEPIRYWHGVFREARLHGPRMLAALLLVVNDRNFPAEAQATRRKLLDLLKAGVGSPTDVTAD